MLIPNNCIILGAPSDLEVEDAFTFHVNVNQAGVPIINTIMTPKEYKVIKEVIMRSINDCPEAKKLALTSNPKLKFKKYEKRNSKPAK